MITLGALRQEFKPAILKLAEKHGVRNVRVFGSVARGDNREDSDVDLLVDLEKTRTLFDLARFQLDLQDLLKVKAQVVTPPCLRYHRDHITMEAKPL